MLSSSQGPGYRSIFGAGAAPVGSRRWHRTAFTLIEVLVVVAIIALLVGILLPSLARARDAGRATVCAAHMKHGGDSAFMWIQTQQNDRRLTNTGWAAGALRMAGGQTGIFTCPSDTKPSPIPAFFVQMYHGEIDGHPYAVVSPDGPFNRISPETGNSWQLNIQDSIDSIGLGGDADAIDSLYRYSTPAGSKTTTVTQSMVSAGDNFSVIDHKGRTVFANAKLAVGRRFNAPLLWGSFGLSVTAGAKNVKGNPILLAEYSNWGIFAEPVGSYPAHNFKKRLRLRHGGSSPAGDGLSDVEDSNYEPRERANCAFRDGHVERPHWQKLCRQIDPIGLNYKSEDAVTAYTSLWLGTPSPRPPGWRPAF